MGKSLLSSPAGIAVSLAPSGEGGRGGAGEQIEESAELQDTWLCAPSAGELAEYSGTQTISTHVQRIYCPPGTGEQTQSPVPEGFTVRSSQARGLPWCPVAEIPRSQCCQPGFDPWSGK